MNSKRKSISDTTILLTITIVVFFAMYIGAMLLQGKGFLKLQTFLNILNANAALILMSCGLTLVMIIGSIDISVGGVAALVSMCCAVYLDRNVLNPEQNLTPGNVAVSMLIALGIGLAYGLIQGYLIAYLDIQPFIVSLAGMFFARGMTTIVHTNPFNVENEAFNKLKEPIRIAFLGTVNKKGKLVPAKIEIGVFVALLVVLILFFVLRYTKLGRSFYAVGGNRTSALMLGINVKRTKFFAHLMCGILAGIGGYVYFLHVGSGAASHASGAEMNAIASSIIGGTMLTGGVGNIIGTLFGVLSLATIQSIVSSAGFDQAWWTGITVASMLCLFLVVQSVVIARKKKSLKKQA
ncbi:MAG: sugar ABC transporter permease YjfF [Lachnospiraceae bacterium]|nr:sugar ABC transporter permease YjfF [Lachnospiraceae bacterium]